MELDTEYIEETIAQNDSKIARIIEPVEVFKEYQDKVRMRPRMIVWDPIKQYNIEIICPIHTELKLTPSRRKIESEQHRELYHVDGIVHLYCKHYCCTGGQDGAHVMIASDEGILQQVRNVMEIPFRPFHVAGMTQDLFQHAGHR